MKKSLFRVIAQSFVAISWLLGDCFAFGRLSLTM